MVKILGRDASTLFDFADGQERVMPTDHRASLRAPCQTCAPAFSERYKCLFEHLVGTEGITEKPLNDVRYCGSPLQRGGIASSFAEKRSFCSPCSATPRCGGLPG